MNSSSLVLSQSRSHRPFASFAGIHLNSPYDPDREARRFAEERCGSEAPSICLILGDTLPYLREVLSDRYPEARVLSVYYHDGFPSTFPDHFRPIPPAYFWSPSSRRSLRAYLQEALPEHDIDGLVVLQWPPSAKAFPKQSIEAVTTLEQIVRETTGGVVAATVFSRTWLHNLFSNFLSVETWYSIVGHHLPVVVAASGPSLRRALPLLRKRRGGFYLIALPSSLEALSTNGLTPDLLVAVDAGYWAQLHLRVLGEHESVPLALPFIASRGVWRYSTCPVPLSSGSFIEKELFHYADFSPVEILATGTVAATALEISSLSTDGPLIFAGLDLCFNDLRDHVRPHPFDVYFELQSRKTKPLPTVLFERLFAIGTRQLSEGVSDSPAMRTYAGWFRNTTFPDRLYRLFPSNVDLPKFRPLDETGFSRLTETGNGTPTAPTVRPITTPNLQDRRRALSTMLDAWGNQLRENLAITASTELVQVLREDRWLSSLVGSLDRRNYLQFKRTIRTAASGRQHRQAKELLSGSLERLRRLKRRFVP